MTHVVFLAVFGHTNIDYLAKVERLPGPDQSMAFEGPTVALGGTAANIAVAAAKLGTPVALASLVGDDFPPQFLRHLKESGVDIRSLVRVKGATTPVCWIYSDASHRQVAFINQGAAKEMGRLPINRKAVASARVVHLATGVPAHHLKVASLARRLGKRVSFDPGPELSYVWSAPSFRRMLGRTDTLFLNDGERRCALRYLRVGRDLDLLRFVEELVFTHGRRGSEYLSETDHLKIPASRPRRVVNTTGAGDAFRGGFYAARFRGLALATQLRWGAAAASFSVESPGGQDGLPTTSQLRRRLDGTV